MPPHNFPNQLFANPIGIKYTKCYHTVNLEMMSIQKGGIQMAYPIDQTSYQLGVIFAFSEMVAADLKKMALSLPFFPKDYERLVKDAKRIAKEEGVKLRLEKRLLTTDLFPEEITKGKWVLIIYKYPEVFKKYLSLKSKKEHLINKNNYKGKERKAIAVGFGELLSYRKDVIRRKLTGRGR